jgi:tellurite resistance protein
MDANQHVSPEEASRAHHIIWSMRRFRRRSGEAVDRLIDTVRDRIEADGVPAVLEQASRTMPARLRQSAFAVAVDLMLADAKLERDERQFVTRLAAGLKLRASVADDIVRVMLIKNGA